MIFEGPPLEDVAGIGALTFGGFVAEVVERFGPAEAIAFDDPQRGATIRWSYDDLGREVRSLARALVAAGVRSGEAVAILMGNRPEAVAAILAAASIGAVAAPTSTFAPIPELAQLLAASAAPVVLTQDRLLARRFGDDLATLAPELPALRTVAVLGEASWHDLLAGGDRVDDAAVDRRIAAVAPDDPALLIFSSGTTSTPKGIVHGRVEGGGHRLAPRVRPLRHGCSRMKR